MIVPMSETVPYQSDKVELLTLTLWYIDPHSFTHGTFITASKDHLSYVLWASWNSEVILSLAVMFIGQGYDRLVVSRKTVISTW